MSRVGRLISQSHSAQCGGMCKEVSFHSRASFSDSENWGEMLANSCLKRLEQVLFLRNSPLDVRRAIRESSVCRMRLDEGNSCSH